MRIDKLIKASIFLIIPFSILSCRNDAGDDQSPNFDRTGMLQNYADNLILPAYGELQIKIDSLSSKASAFTSNPTLSNLTSTQNAWIDTYLAWQSANAYNIGPAGEEGLTKGLIEEIGTFPISESKMQNAISMGTYNLNDFNRDARGLLAIEYLLFSLTDDNQAIVSGFESSIRKQLLNDLIANVRTRVSNVYSQWNGGYRAAFINNNGTDVGSSTSIFYNEFVRSFEAIKNFKVRLPLGLTPGQMQAEPTKVEAYYSGLSVRMFKAHMDAIERIWYGQNRAGNDGVGFEEYLRTVTGGEALIASTVSQLALVKSSMAAVPEIPRFSFQVVNSPESATTFHTELQKHTRFFKSDMSSLLGITITFSSGDGD